MYIYMLCYIKGKILFSDGPSCNSDPNASIREFPPPCPSTCAAPNELSCKKMGLDVGCVCNRGYILNKNDGKCIAVDKCPGKLKLT